MFLQGYCQRLVSIGSGHSWSNDDLFLERTLAFHEENNQENVTKPHKVSVTILEKKENNFYIFKDKIVEYIL